MKILVMGGGAQGRVIATDLATTLGDAEIRVADIAKPALPSLGNLSWIEADLADRETIARLLSEHQLGVCALPSVLGFRALEAAIDAQRPVVDVSFSAEDPLVLDREARRAGITIAPDCGLAPGISNLLVGRAAATRGTPSEIVIMVGGVAEDPQAPYGYVVTWSLDDLLEEYTRPARIVKDGRLVSVPVFSDMELVDVEGVGPMEAFVSDGLRSLLHTLPGVRDMAEKTLRWPGHASAIRPVVAAGKLQQALREKCSPSPAKDLVAMLIRVRWGRASEEWVLVDRYDPGTNRTAMSRTTALTTSVVAQLAARGGLGEPGVRPLELVAADEKAFHFVLDGLGRHGVTPRMKA